eukprot:1138462-Pelagomonas_calceolata.AAC.1
MDMGSTAYHIIRRSPSSAYSNPAPPSCSPVVSIVAGSASYVNTCQTFQLFCWRNVKCMEL